MRQWVRNSVLQAVLGTVAATAMAMATVALAAPSSAASPPGTISPTAWPKPVSEQARFDSLNPVAVTVAMPMFGIIPSPQNIIYSPSPDVRLAWKICMKKKYGDNAAGDCYWAPTPDATGVVQETKRVVWTFDGRGEWSTPNQAWNYSPRNWATLGAGRYLFPIVTVVTKSGAATVDIEDLAPDPEASGALIVNTLPVTTPIGALRPSMRLSAATFTTTQSSTIQFGRIPVNYEYFARDHVNNTMNVPMDVWSCPRGQAVQPGSYYRITNTIAGATRTTGNIDQIRQMMLGCKAIALPCPQCLQIRDSLRTPASIAEAQVNAREFLLENLALGVSADMDLYPVQAASITTVDSVTGDKLIQDLYAVGAAVPVRVRAALPIIVRPLPDVQFNVGANANNGIAAEAANGGGAADAGAAGAGADAGAVAGGAPAAGDAGNAGAAAPAATESGAGAAPEASSSAPAGLAAATGINLTLAPLAGTDGTGTRGSTTLRLVVPVVQPRGKSIPLRAFVAPRASGRVTFSLVRVAPSGTVVLGKAKTARVSKGRASARWVLARSKPTGKYSVYASFVPSKSSSRGGVKGVTVSRGVTLT